MAKAAGLTPMMEQYMSIKEQYKHCLLFYRLGDFYELFFDDALVASKELELTLTGKDCGLEERAPMCGVPFHSAESYISRLVENGYKVAVCEQTEDPKQAKGIVKREVIRIVTPGTLLDTGVLDESRNNYITCICKNADGYGVATCDVTTGDMLVTDCTEKRTVIDELARFTPAEIIVNAACDLLEDIERIFDKKPACYDETAFDYRVADVCLCNHFSVINLEGYGIADKRSCVSASGALMSYLSVTQMNALEHISSLRYYNSGKYMLLDISSRRNLELTKTMRDGAKKGSLLWVIDKTKTAMGARQLRNWTEQPLKEPAAINKRLDCVESFTSSAMERDELTELLSKVYDIERIMAKIIYATNNARDLTALKQSLGILPSLKEHLLKNKCEYVRRLGEELDPVEDIFALIDEAIDEDAPFSVREGGMIKAGYNKEVDDLRNAKNSGTQWLTELERTERERTGIKNLRVKFNKVFGYFIEVTNSYKDMVPETYVRKQTLTNCERYITDELKKLEDSILGADEKLNTLEYELFSAVRRKTAEQVERINASAKKVGITDALISLADVAVRNNYVRPAVNESGVIDIKDGRHPVVEAVSKQQFIPNDIYLDRSDNRLNIITGPNMAGKSTYMRQCALIVLLAQMGSFVPARSANIGVCDRIFTRVGASDDLATGQSTFMVEMVEVASILNNATSNSLLILDEIGRGTSTYDGLSIAWAVLEYINEKIGARTLFATHYHELTDLEGKTAGIVNKSVSVKEKDGDVIFLRKIVNGGADKSYGVHVAGLAGVPDAVLSRANDILYTLTLQKEGMQMPDPTQIVHKEEKTDPVLEELRKSLLNEDINNMTPIQAMQKLYEIKEILSK